MAALLGVSEEVAAAAILALESNEEQGDDEELAQAVLAGITPSEKTPSAGTDGQHGVDLEKSFGTLVVTMLNAHKPSAE